MAAERGNISPVLCFYTQLSSFLMPQAVLNQKSTLDPCNRIANVLLCHSHCIMTGDDIETSQTQLEAGSIFPHLIHALITSKVPQGPIDALPKIEPIRRIPRRPGSWNLELSSEPTVQQICISWERRTRDPLASGRSGAWPQGSSSLVSTRDEYYGPSSLHIYVLCTFSVQSTE